MIRYFVLVSCFFLLPVSSQVTVGIEGTVCVEFPENTWEAVPFQEEAKITVRIAKREKKNDAYIYTLKYIGYEPGTYNIYDYILKKGKKINQEKKVMIIGILPKNYKGVLGNKKQHTISRFIHYKTFIIWFGISWGISLLLIIFVKRKKKTKKEKKKLYSIPTREAIYNLIEIANKRRLTKDEKRIFEGLIITYWRKELDIQSWKTDTLIPLMKEDEIAGKLIKNLEEHLYKPRSKIKFRDIITIIEGAIPYKVEE